MHSLCLSGCLSVCLGLSVCAAALKESLFKESDGLLQSIRQSCADKSKPLPDARLYGLNTCAKFIWRCGRDAGLQHHMPAILRSGFGLFQKDESKRVKRAALYLMLEVIKCNARCGSPLSAQEMEIDKHIGRLMEELKSFRTKMGPQAQGALYALFAGMIDLYDNHFSPQQLRDIASTIKTVMESSMSNLSKGFEPSLIEGVMKGLESLLHRYACCLPSPTRRHVHPHGPLRPCVCLDGMKACRRLLPGRPARPREPPEAVHLHRGHGQLRAGVGRITRTHESRHVSVASTRPAVPRPAAGRAEGGAGIPQQAARGEAGGAGGCQAGQCG